MKRTALLVIALALILNQCGKSADPSGNRHQLVNDFNYAKQVSYGSQSTAPFARNKERIEQNDEPGNISFAVKLYQNPVLAYTVKLKGGDKSDLDVQVTVQSDYPDRLKREYKPSINKKNEQSLGEFSNRLALITFSARSRKLPRIDGSVTWIDPVIEQKKPESSNVQAKPVESFRKKQKPANVLIFVFDAARASHIGAYGYPKPTTPVIDSVAAEGVIWRNAFTPAASTRPSVGTLFTGVLPDVHKVFKKPTALQEGFTTMAECFRQAGFETALFTANPNASDVAGYGQGFQHIWNLRQGRTVFAHEVVEYVNKWLDQVKNRQFFGYIHFREPHEPYKAPANIMEKFTSEPDFQLPDFKVFETPDEKTRQKVLAAYDANLASADEQFGFVVQKMKEKGLYEKTLIIIISDHGEAFWEHGKQGHNSQVYEEVTHIPMIMRFPNSPELKGMKREQIVGTVDLFPTFADLFQFPNDLSYLNGQSLLPLLLIDTKTPDRIIVTETARQEAWGLRSPQFKYIHYRTDVMKSELYYLPTDPQEKQNVIADYPVHSAYYQLLIGKLRVANKALVAKLNVEGERQIAVDPETEEELKALGYVN